MQTSEANLRISRRDFGNSLIGSFLGVACLYLTGCNLGSIWLQIQAWIPLGIDAFDSVVELVAPLAAPGIEAIATLVKAGFASLAAAINEYLSADPATKTTLVGKIKDILTAISDNIQNFLNLLGTSSSPLVKIALGLLKILLSTIGGFVAKVVPGAAVGQRRYYHAGPQSIEVDPILRDKKKFTADFNAACVASGHSELQIPRKH